MSRSLVYYITGHGFGHARRSAAVIRRLVADTPDLSVHIRTSAAAHIFDDTVGPRVEYHSASLDPGAVEDDALRINPGRTIASVRACLRHKAALIETELNALPRDLRLIVADIPFLAGDIAEATGIPCLAVGNFTWDWIYEPQFDGQPDGPEIIHQIQSSYAKMAAIFKLPFGGRTEMFPRVIRSPIIVNGTPHAREQVRQKLCLSHEKRPLVLVGQRGGIAPQVLDRAVRGAPDFLFLCPQNPPPQAPSNLLQIQLTPDLRFSDILAACDVVISKLGHSTLSDCIGAGVAILWPERAGFREDRAMAGEAAPFVRMCEISVEDFELGRWSTALDQLIQSPPPNRKMPSNGDVVCAREIARWL